jgi:transcription antitermination factor NusG
VTYLPLAAVRIRDRVLRTMTRLVDRPLFPNYAFVALGEHDPWTPARYAPGVAALLMGDGEPQHLDAGVLEAVQAAVAARRCLTPENTQWAPGALCSLLAGPFSGLPAIVTSLHRDEATITLMFLGHLRNVSVNLDCLKARDDG